MKINDAQASDLALIKILKDVNLSNSQLETTIVALLQHIYPNNINKVLLFIQEMSKVSK